MYKVAPKEKTELKEVKPTEAEYMSFCGGFHPKTSHVLNLKNKGYGIHITTVSTITGCGIVQCYGVGSLQGLTEEQTEEAKKFFKDVVIKHCMETGAGAIICTLGQASYGAEKAVLACGFTLVKEYSNYRHGMDGKYKQRLYILTF